MTSSPGNFSFLPYGRQFIDGDDIDAVVRVLESDLLTTGPATQAFEASLQEITSAAHAVSCSSGTAGLHLAAMALWLGPGDSVIVPTITFLATANAARFTGADVVFADVDPDTGLMRPDDLLQALHRPKGRAKAVFPVYLAGQSPDMEAIAEIANKNGLSVVEDACHALGGTYDNAAAGSCAHADMSVFSFHPVKIIAMGEGGAVTTNDEALSARLRMLRNHGMTRDAGNFDNDSLSLDENGASNPWSYEMPELGFNYRASDIHCALGLSQIGKLDQFVNKRRALAELYDEKLAPLAPVVRPTARTPGDPAWHLYVVLIDFEMAGISRAALMRSLHEKGIGTQVHYIPVHTQPYYSRLYGDQDLPGATAYYSRCLSLPLHVAMTDGDVERVVHDLESVLT